MSLWLSDNNVNRVDTNSNFLIQILQQVENKNLLCLGISLKEFKKGSLTI